MAIVSGETYAKARGKCGNMVLQQTASGTVMMGVAEPVNPQTPGQMAQRRVFSGSIAGYVALSQTQHLAWIALGKTMTVLGKRKQTVTLSGIAAYNSLNSQRTTLGLPLLGDAPKFTELPPKLPAFTLSATRGGSPTGSLSLQITPVSEYTGASVQIWATDAMRPSVHSISPNAYRLVAVEASLPAFSVDIANKWTAKFGAAPVNSKIAVKLIAVTENGFVGDPMMQTCLVTLG